MNLADMLNRMADETVVPPMPEPAVILRGGDRLRARARRRVVVGAAALAMVAVAAVATMNRVADRSTPQPAHRIDGWSVTRTIDAPGNGIIVYADDSLWVVDGRNGQLTEDGVLAGEMYQIDPATGGVLDRIPAAVGGWVSVGAGCLWMSSVTASLLNRVDMASHEVTRISRPPEPDGSAFAAGSVWVAYNAAGDLVRLDPGSGQVTKTIHVGEDYKGDSPSVPISDGESVWVSTDNGELLRYDGATGKRLSWMQLPYKQLRLLGLDPSRRTLYAKESSGKTLLEIDADGRVAWEGRELRFSPIQNRSFVGDVAVGDDAIWVATTYPDELLRVDPVTFKVTGRMPLTGIDHESNVPVDIEVGNDTLWVRTKDQVLALQRAH